MPSNSHEPYSYIDSRAPPAHHRPQATEMNTQPNLGTDQHQNKFDQSMEAQENIPFRSKLQSLHVNDHNHLGDHSNEKSHDVDIENTLAEAVELAFQSANTKKMCVFIRFLKIAL